MAIAYFPAFDNADVLEIVFFRLNGEKTFLGLLVDSGFVGESSFVLSNDLTDLLQAPANSLQAKGAIQGVQQRIILPCEITSLSLQLITFAILTDLALL